MSPAKRIATAAVTAVLLAGTPGLAMAATPQTTLPSQQTETWYQLRVWPLARESARNLDVDSNGKAITATPRSNDDRQQWNLSDTTGKQLIKNKATGTCLTAPGGDLNGSVTLKACDKNDVNQQWTVRSVEGGKVEILPSANHDLALTGGLSGEVRVWYEDGSRAQGWSTVPPGS
ncbi:RICIN domain-containing protein [Streptomyces sp. CBMA156]|uniref:RICIN domain-containing protein n=1 Tax=Streptomyces sp. CBMA156 TaxID=1930280 RepID=UPI0016621395|nr:RICIN domain-containing protein [Streptomyces sp. CBMA156]MBD0672710.1 hypothetical protein [Streptomyces sp. CBMA156]